MVKSKNELRCCPTIIISLNHLSVGKKNKKQIAYNYTLNETRPNNNGNNINKICFDLAGKKSRTLQSK